MYQEPQRAFKLCVEPHLSDHVQVPRSRFKPCNALYTHLSIIDPLEISDDFGCSFYLHVIDIVGHHF